MSSTFLSNLEWRNAEKNFDPSREVSEGDLNKILNAIKMAPSSFGLQPFHIYVVSDQDAKMKLKEKGFNQQQFEDASHILVFCGRNDISDRIDEYFEVATNGDAEKRKAMEGYEQMMRGFSEGKNEEAINNWAFKQAYIALGFALAACAELEIDSCPIEGFNPAAFDEILNVPENIKSVVALPIGYSKNDSKHPKVRFSEDDLFTKI